MRTEVLLPTYNEAENIERLLDEILAQDERLSVMVVDDRSPDGTARLARAKAEQYPGRIDVFERNGPKGRGLAGIAGFQRALGKPELEAVVEMDADFSHAPEALPHLLQALTDYDVVIGSRYVPGGKVEGWGPARVLNSWLANNLTRLILGLSYQDCTSGYRAYRRSVVAALPWEQMISTNPAIVEEVLLLCHRRGFRIGEVPITFVDRTLGSSKLHLGTVFWCFVNLFRIRFRRYSTSAQNAPPE